MRILHDGSMVSDDTPVKDINGGLHRLGPADLARNAEKAAERRPPAPTPRERLARAFPAADPLTEALIRREARARGLTPDQVLDELAQDLA